MNPSPDSGNTAADAASQRAPAPPLGTGPRCDCCGAPLLERHCELVCLNCGMVRDCSDP